MISKKHALSVILLTCIVCVITVGAFILLRDHTSRNGSSDSSQESPVASSEPESSSESVEDLSSDSTEDTPAMISITIPDRSTYPQILSIIAQSSGQTEEIVSRQAESLLAYLPEAASDCYFPLEGYILSGSYEVANDDQLLFHILTDSLDRIASLSASEGSYNLHELLTAASIIEMEASCGGASEHHPAEMPHIASVIFNRLSNSMQLQMDVTFQYGEDTLAPHGADETILDQYNTYTAPALPIGPICSPSEDAIAAALTPEHSDDLFFVFDEESTYYYAETYEEHLDNCRLIGIR